MEAEDILMKELKETGYEFMRQGSMMEDEEYPDDFFTFWNNGTNGSSYYDNDSESEIYDFDVNFYSSNPQNTYDVLRSITKKLKACGFIVTDSGHDVMSDVETHTGRGISVLFMK